jgi:AcrR family transcriptional regulator
MTKATEPPRQGLRERKKQHTRQLIAETARGLFVARGFDHVPVAEIARAADVSEQTVFNYFPAKEDLVYWRLGAFEEEMLEAVRSRGAGVSVLGAFRDFVMGKRGLLGRVEPAAEEQLAEMARMISDSSALVAREQQIFDGYAVALAALIAAERGTSADDVEAQTVASALIGAHQALVRYTRARVLGGARPPGLTREVRAQARRAFARLEAGLGDYGAEAAA